MEKIFILLAAMLWSGVAQAVSGEIKGTPRPINYTLCEDEDFCMSYWTYIDMDGEPVVGQESLTVVLEKPDCDGYPCNTELLRYPFCLGVYEGVGMVIPCPEFKPEKCYMYPNVYRESPIEYTCGDE